MDFQFVHLTYTCTSCARVVFTPVLLTDVLGLFWCQFVLPQMDLLVVPEQLALVGCTFKVQEFYMSKGRFHTVSNNTVYSNNIVKSPQYGMIGNTLDMQYAKQTPETCISCQDSNDSIQSRCSCPDRDKFIAGECRKTINATELVAVPSGISYFIDCSDARNGFVTVNFNDTLDVSRSIAVLKDDSCTVTNVQIEGQILATTGSSLHNTFSGLSYYLTNSLSNVNTSLFIQQNGDGMGATALLGLRNNQAIVISYVRISGSIVGNGTTTREFTALMVGQLGAQLNATNVGFFGGLLNQTADHASFGVAGTFGYRLVMIDIFLVPALPSSKQSIDTMYVESSSWSDPTFPCYKQSSYDMQLSLKMRQYLDRYDGSYVNPLMMATPGNTEFGGLVSIQNGTETNIFRRIITVLDVKNSNNCPGCQGLGIIFGQVSVSFILDRAYAEGNVTYTNWRTGVIGSIGDASLTVNVEMTLAAKAKLTSNSENGVIGTIFQGTHRIYILADLDIQSSAIAGFLGISYGGTYSMMCVGRVQSNVTNQFGKILGLVYGGEGAVAMRVNGILYSSGGSLNDIGGCSVNSCSDQDLESRAEVVANSFVRVDEAGWVNFYMLTCQKDKRIKVSQSNSLSNAASMRVLQDDSCIPVNLEVSGTFTIATNAAGSHNVSLSGLLRTITTTLGFINTSLVLKHTNYNTTRYISLIAWNASVDAEISMIRISGEIQGETGSPAAEDRLSGVLISKVVGRNLIISNIGVYGLTSLFGGTVASGLVGYVSGGSVLIHDILIVGDSDDQYLMSQLLYEAYNYLGDQCANYLDAQKGGSVNMRQYLSRFQSSRETSFTYSIRSSQKVGGLVGQADGSAVTVYRVAVRLGLAATADVSEAGLLFGAVSGTLNLNQTYVTGNLTGSSRLTKAGAIGALSGQGALEMMVVLRIDGATQMGTIGAATSATFTLSVYFDNNITHQGTSGGLVGKATSSSLSYPALLGRVAFSGVLTGQGNIIGDLNGAPVNSASDASINVC